MGYDPWCLALKEAIAGFIRWHMLEQKTVPRGVFVIKTGDPDRTSHSIFFHNVVKFPTILPPLELSNLLFLHVQYWPLVQPDV